MNVSVFEEFVVTLYANGKPKPEITIRAAERWQKAVIVIPVSTESKCLLMW